MSEMITVPGRSINTITAEILTITAQTNQMVAMNAIEVGRRLVEAKAMVAHGEWGEYLSKEVKFSQSTANNLMKIFREYGDNPNSQALGNLPYTKMVRLLAVPEEERAEFVQQHDVSEMSTRELEQAIKERNAAQEQLAIAQDNNRALEEASTAANKALADEKAKAEKALSRVTYLENQVQTARAAENASQQKVSRLEKQLEQAKKAENAAKEKLQKMKDNPEVPADVIEKLANEAANRAEQDFTDKLNAARQEAEAAAQAKADAEQALAEARKSAQLSSPDAAAFNVMFTQVQEDFNKLHGYLIKLSNADGEVYAKCRRALNDRLDYWKEVVAQ